MSKLKLLRKLSLTGGGFLIAGMLNEITNLATRSADAGSSDNASFDKLSIILFGLAGATVIPALLISYELLAGEYKKPLEQVEANDMMGLGMTNEGYTAMNNHYDN